MDIRTYLDRLSIDDLKKVRDFLRTLAAQDNEDTALPPPVPSEED
jgi:hypothetical protein